MWYYHLGPSTKLTSLPGPHFITQEEMRANTRIFPFKRIDMGWKGDVRKIVYLGWGSLI